jgi:RNA polymerase sigma-70 factor (ECF subfamily)
VTQPADTEERAALSGLVREQWPRVLASLVRTTGSLQLAEDALQDAAVRALEVWARDGVPAEPRAWLTVVARRRAVDMIRREVRRPDKEVEALVLRQPVGGPVPEAGEVRDDLLRLLFTCCHPALPMEAQTALALRTLCGLSTAEVASALLVGEPTMAKRLVRAKRKIAVARIPYRTPTAEELPERLQGVLTTVYLLFNEGYHATSGDSPLRQQLTAEAIRLAALMRELLPDQVSVVGLEALLRLHDARSPARLDRSGGLVRLSEQDRTLWDSAAIQAGLSLLGRALRHSSPRPDPYVVQAAIAACHDLAPTWDETNWEAIVSWYDVLLTVTDTPIVRLNRAVAIAELHDAELGLAELDRIGDLPDYLPLVAARAELLARAGRTEEAQTAFALAIAMPGNQAARRELSRRMAEMMPSPG